WAGPRASEARHEATPAAPRRIAASSQGMPRQEGKSAFLTLSKHILRRAVGEIVTVLHRDDRRDALRSLTLTLERPMCRILPLLCSSASAPTDSSSGTCGSGACS